MDNLTASDIVRVVVWSPFVGFGVMFAMLGALIGALLAIGAIFWFVDKVESWMKK